jgi:hypothetical protein
LTPESILKIWYGSWGLQLISAPIYIFQDLTLESILGETRYGSRGLHLIGAPIQCTYLHFSKNLVEFGQSHLVLDQSQIALNMSFHVRWSTQQLHRSRKIWLIKDQSSLAKHSETADDVWYHEYHVFWTWQKGTWGSTKSRPTQPKSKDQGAHNRGGLEDNYRIKSYK